MNTEKKNSFPHASVRCSLLRQRQLRVRPVRRAGDRRDRVDLRRDTDGGRRVQREGPHNADQLPHRSVRDHPGRPLVGQSIRAPPPVTARSVRFLFGSPCTDLADGTCPCSCRVRFPYPFQWGYPIFCFQDCFAMMAASFASLIEV
jgi:hypothetical protein